jgi:hypothetical protein
MDIERVKQASTVDIIFRLVDGCGVLPIVIVDGEEIYRGEFKNYLGEALTRIDRNFPDLRSDPRFQRVTFSPKEI